jgi:hypothetical protein
MGISLEEGVQKAGGIVTMEDCPSFFDHRCASLAVGLSGFAGQVASILS